MPNNLGKHPQVSMSVIQSYSSPTGHKAPDHDHNLLHRPNHSDQRCPIPAPPPSQTDKGTANSLISLTGGEEGKNNGGGSDAESDKKDTDDEDEDEDGVAPSESAIILDDSQAGHKHEERACSRTIAGQKRKRSVSLEGETLANAEAEDVKRTRKAEEAIENSDADDYAGVDLISDSEEVDCSIEKLEEGHIIASEEDRRDDLDLALGFSPEDWYEFDMHSGLVFPDYHYLEGQYSRTDPVTLSNEVELYNSTVIVRDQSPPPRTSNGRRRVRFADLPHGLPSGDGSETSQDMQSSSYRWEKDKTPNTRRGKIVEGDDDECGSPQKNSRKSQVEPKPSQKRRVRSNSFDENFEGSCGSSSGYETDLGETTEEDDVSPYRSQLLLRQASESSLRHERSQAPIPLHRPSQKGQRPGPPMGSWIAASTKPIALIDKTGTSLIIFRAPQEAQTNQRTPHRVASGNSTANTSPLMSRPSFSSDIGYSPDCSEFDPSEFPGRRYAARLNQTELIPPLLLHQNPGISACKHPPIDEVIQPSVPYFPPPEWSPEEAFSQYEESEENLSETLVFNDFIDFTNASEESRDDTEYSATTIRDPSPSRMANYQNVPTEAQPSQTLIDHLSKGIVTALHRDRYRNGNLTLSHREGDILDSFNVPVDHGLYATTSASLSPEMRPAKKRRMSDGPSRAESISQAKAALAAMS